MEKEAWIMKIANLKLSTEEEPSFHDVVFNDNEGIITYVDSDGWPHNLNGPAIEYANGNKEWRIHGILHRLDGPAVEWPNGDKWWYVNNELIGKSREGFTDEDFEKWKKKYRL